MSASENECHEMATGHCAVLAALVIALDESGVMPKEVYSDALHRLWQDMPEDEAIGEAGAVIERVLDMLESPGGSGSQSDDKSDEQSRWNFVDDPVNDDSFAQSA